jgi:hypothetical protein
VQGIDSVIKAYFGGKSGRIFRYRIVDGGPKTVRFPLKKRVDVDHRLRATTSEPIPFVPPAPMVAEAPAPDEGGVPDYLFQPEVAPARAEPPRPFTFPLRNQATAADSRADRLVRQIRGEVEQLREALDALVSEQDEMVEVDPASVMENPDAAATLPPAVLVRTIVSAHEENVRLKKRLSKQGRRQSNLRRRYNELELEDVARRSRLDTLEEVLAALHANLLDLRLERDSQRLLPEPASQPVLRPVNSEYPVSGHFGGTQP